MVRSAHVQDSLSVEWVSPDCNREKPSLPNSKRLEISDSQSSQMTPLFNLPTAAIPLLLEKDVSEMIPMFSLLYYLIQHCQTCSQGCYLEKYCIWFRTLVHHIRSCLCENCSVLLNLRFDSRYPIALFSISCMRTTVNVVIHHALLVKLLASISK